MQYLEGPQEAIEQLFEEKISKDVRHREVTVYFRHAISARLFPNWAMALRGGNELPPDLAAESERFFTAGFGSLSTAEGEAQKLLLRFRDYG